MSKNVDDFDILRDDLHMGRENRSRSVVRAGKMAT